MVLTELVLQELARRLVTVELCSHGCDALWWALSVQADKKMETEMMYEMIALALKPCLQPKLLAKTRVCLLICCSCVRHSGNVQGTAKAKQQLGLQ